MAFLAASISAILTHRCIHAEKHTEDPHVIEDIVITHGSDDLEPYVSQHGRNVGLTPACAMMKSAAAR